MDRLLSSVRQAWRANVATPGTSVMVVAVAALGIGLLAAMFGLADPYIGGPLPYSAPDRLVAVETRRMDRVTAAGRDPLSLLAPIAQAPTVEDWARRSDLFQRVAGFRRRSALRLRLPEGAAVLRLADVTKDFLDTLGVSSLDQGSFDPGSGFSPTPVLLTSSAFTRIFASTPEVIGRVFEIEGGGTVRLSGVLPSTFLMPERCCFAPVDALTPAAREFRAAPGTVLARVQDGVTAEHVASSLRTMLNEDQFELDVRPLQQHLAGGTSRLAWAALAAGGLIALICAANLGNLFAARGLFRAEELATRKALGATPMDFAWMLLTEVGLTKAVACVLGLAVAAVVLALLARVMPIEYVTLGRPAVTWRVVLVAAAASLFLMLSTLGPAALAWRCAIRRSGTQVPDGRQVRVLRFCLGAGQATLAVILLVGATFLVHSEANLFGLDSGFSGDVHAVKVSYPASLTPPRLQEDVGRTLEAFARIPGVSRTAAAWGALVDKTIVPGFLTIGGRLVSVSPKFVTTDYFSSLGSRLVGGHLTVAPGTAVINQTLARSYFMDRSPLGQLIGSQNPVEIVGIIADELDWALDQPPSPTVYYALESLSSCGPGCDINYVLRLSTGRRDVDGIVAFATRSTSRDAVVVEQSRLRDRLTSSVADRSFATMVVTLFACAGISVVTVGLFAMVAFIVARRTREIAIRAAIGAGPRRLLWAVVHETVWMCGVGIAVGTVVGGIVSHMLEHQLFGVQPGDPVLLATASAAMLVVALVAALVPGWRALRIAPSVALRSE